MNALGIIAFVVALLLSVMLHEAGHFLMARRFGMKVTEFFVGFGPRLWSVRRGEVEYGVKAIPAGGYVRIVGMTPSEELSAEDEPRAFYKARIRHRVITLAAGSIVHFIVGYVLILLMLIFVGVGTYTAKLSYIGECVPAYKATACAPADPISPAKSAGLLVGDQILAIDGVAMKDWASSTDVIRTSVGKQLDLTIDRKGEQIHLSVTPIARVGADGKSAGYVGIGPSFEYIRTNPLVAIPNAATSVWHVAWINLKGLAAVPTKIPDLWNQTFHGKARDTSGLVGVVGVARVSGETLDAQGLNWKDKLSIFISIIAGLNIFVGIFNALPLPPLDGGHIAVAIADRFRMWRAKRRGVPNPPAIDVARLTPITLVVLTVLISLSFLLLAADIINPMRLNS
ncbi:unannotated protein [freshwater metagenome]|uniref:Unannotated protein n=1 Tax=freshwater metagenome TaxID=449393 RepID=A0A6J6NWM3_9ZZZZ|nr:PDZ domain-containing protein [Actinomycetota bacterium]MSY51488.1 PDZ domain-containing protein [Actinomycetota bacterium]MSY87864.1 PDZ domain-containing protein [Actinomycetota bacterium]